MNKTSQTSKMNKKRLMEILDRELETYAVIYKSRIGTWRVLWNLTEIENTEVKSIIMNKLESYKQ